MFLFQKNNWIVFQDQKRGGAGAPMLKPDAWQIMNNDFFMLSTYQLIFPIHEDFKKL